MPTSYPRPKPLCGPWPKSQCFTHRNTDTSTLTRMQACTHLHERTRTRTHIHASTLKHTYTHARIHAHINTLPPVPIAPSTGASSCGPLPTTQRRTSCTPPTTPSPAATSRLTTACWPWARRQGGIFLHLLIAPVRFGSS